MKHSICVHAGSYNNSQSFRTAYGREMKLLVSKHGADILLHRQTFDFMSGLKGCWKEEHLHSPLQMRWTSSIVGSYVELCEERHHPFSIFAHINKQ
jgi:hypothetical protein